MLQTLANDLERIDIDLVRADTPAAEARAHLNNAGASLPPQAVVNATVDYLLTESREGGYETAAARASDLDRVYRETATMLNCAEDELAFQQNASQGWWAAFNSVPLEPGDRILATSAEYVASGIGLVRAAERGVQVDLIPDDESGQVSVDGLVDLLDERVKLVCATHVPTSGGLVNPVNAIGAAVRAKSEARYLVDACQSAGQLPLDVEAMHADFVAFTGRKFCRGPRGTGMLYERAGLTGLLPPRINDGWGNDWTAPWSAEALPGARRHELYEYTFAGKVGLGVALGYANELGLDNIAARTGALASQLRSQLSDVDGVDVADRGATKCGIVTFSVRSHSPEQVMNHLTARGINTSTARVEAAQFDLSERAPNGLVRASVHYFNTIAEIDRTTEAVAELG